MLIGDDQRQWNFRESIADRMISTPGMYVRTASRGVDRTTVLPMHHGDQKLYVCRVKRKMGMMMMMLMLLLLLN